jgi:hypothetical protein
MNILGRAAQRVPSEWFRKPVVDLLFARTAEAFAAPLPQLRSLAGCEVLLAYAEFTALAAVGATTLPEGNEAERRLFDTAEAVGERLRRLFGVCSMADAMAIARWCYRVLDIDFHGNARGEVRIPRCSFSRHYSPAACKAMSALDIGLLAGLTGGGRLVFSQRLTEGFSCCRARILTEPPA